MSAEPSRVVEQLVLHEQADLVPAMSAGEYEALRDDIANRGIQTPLEITRAGVVLDGRHRLQAARELKLPEVPVRIVAPPDEAEYLVLGALHRRHFSKSQKAAVAVSLDSHQQARTEALDRRTANLRQGASIPDVAALPHRGERTRQLIARTAGVSERCIQDALTVYQADPLLFEDVRSGRLSVETAARRVLRARRDQQIPPAPPLPDGPFAVILADPAWQLGNPDSAYAPENHYPTLPLDQIKDIQVPAADNGILYLWTVANLIPQALEVMAAWGFNYRTEIVWVKPSIGLGNWVRHRHEPLLIGARGTFPLADPEDRPDSVIEAPRGRHSQKPVEIYERIEKAHPGTSKLELFARTTRPGWVAWGNQVDAS